MSLDEDPYPQPGGDGSNWRTSSFSDQTECVEVSVSRDVVRVRNSRDRRRPFLAFDIDRWADFTAGIRRGEFPASRSAS
jgi:hypothetical protein